MKITETRRRRAGLGGVLLACAAAVTAVIVTVPVAAGYTDSANARSDSIMVADPIPPFMPGISKNSRQVDTGLGLSPSGDVYQWGRTNLSIGGGATAGTDIPPARVPLPSGTIRQVTGGIYNANAVDVDGTVWGWGTYDSRDGTDASKPNDNPRQIRIGTAWNGAGPLLDGILTISSTEYAGAGIRTDGSIWIWGGSTGYGGNGATAGASKLSGMPDPSLPGNRPVYLKGAYTNFFTILENGDVWYWGGSSSLPSGASATNMTGMKLTALNPWMKNNVAPGSPYVIAVDGGINMGGAILSDGTFLSWGGAARIGNRPGAAGTPGIVPGLTGITSMQFSFTGVAMLNTANELWGYGASDDYGNFPTTPARIDTDVVQYGSGQGYYLWQKSNGQFWGRGYNPTGAIGLPSTSQTTNRLVSYDMSELVI